MTLSRRGLFKGVLGLLTLPFLPQISKAEPTQNVLKEVIETEIPVGLFHVPYVPQYTKVVDLSKEVQFTLLKEEVEKYLTTHYLEVNDSQLRQLITHDVQKIVDHYMDNFPRYRNEVICDGRNNTPEQIDDKELNVDIVMHPLNSYLEYLIHCSV